MIPVVLSDFYLNKISQKDICARDWTWNPKILGAFLLHSHVLTQFILSKIPQLGMHEPVIEYHK